MRGEFYSWIILTFAAVVMAGILGAVIAAGLITRKKKKYYMSTGFHAGSQLGAVYARPPETVQDTQTSVLGERPAETGCLDTGFACPCAMLIRRKTGERSDVKRPLFLIGKERQRADFWIADNEAVSRIHAGIVCKGDECYLIDRNSTNGTYLNERRIESGQEVLLKPGDRIKLADEELDFWL